MLVNESIFNQCVEKLGHIPFEQDKGWRDYEIKRGMSYLYFVDSEQQPTMACCGRVLKKPLVGKILDIMGEVKSKMPLSEKVMRNFYHSIIEDAGCDMILYNSKAVYDFEMEIAIRRAGFNRPLGFCTCPLTIYVDLLDDTERKRDRNWKRNAKKAAESNLAFEHIEHPTMEDAEIICHMFDEMSETKHLGYTLKPESLYILISSPRYRLYFVRKEGRVLCARIVYVYGEMAEDVFAANSNESRECSATHFMMDCVFNDLKTTNAKVFDFSRIPPSDNETDSVYVFKRATGGGGGAYLGEWMWTKKRITPLLYSIYNFYFRKAHHY